MTMPETAFVLCAGFGKRMGPLTQDCPKPLLPVWAKPMVDFILRRLERVGVKRLVVNAHYLAPQIIEHLKSWQGRFETILVSYEEAILETGGGIRQALPLLGDKPFWVVNGDVIFDPQESSSLFDYLGKEWERLGESGKVIDGLLGLIPQEKAWGYEGRGDFFQETNGEIYLRGDKDQAPYVYIGVQILDPQKLSAVAPGHFPAKVFWDLMIQAHTLYGFLWGGSWFHVGTQKAYQDLPPR